MIPNELYTLGFHHTCSVDKPEHNGITYARDITNLMKLAATDKRVFAFVPTGWRDILHSDPNCNVSRLPYNVTIRECEDPILEWALIHNEIHQVRLAAPNDIDLSAVIHPTAVVGVDGARYLERNDTIIPIAHIGNVVIRSSVFIGANTVIERGLIDSTIIHQGVRIGNLCLVGHNTEVGPDCIVTACVHIAGSCKIGANSWLGIGSVIRNGIELCDHVMLGCGAVAVKDIKEPGVFVGNPARFLRAAAP